MAIQQVTQQVAAAREQVVATIRRAAENQGVDFDYLLQQARVESGLDPNARARTSSATGLFQFTAGTWLAMVKKHGDKVGLGAEASSLRSERVGAAERNRILALRNDPDTSAQLAARFALDNAQSLAKAGHRAVGSTELYLAHFLGASGAAAFLDGLKNAPGKAAAAILPSAAQANLRIFYDGAAPRSFQEIYDRFAKKFTGAATTVVAAAEVATPTPTKPVPETRLREIVAQVLAPPKTEPAPGEPATARETNPAQLSADSLVAFLKNFELVDPQKDLARRGSPVARDASEGAGLHPTETSPDDALPVQLVAQRQALR